MPKVGKGITNHQLARNGKALQLWFLSTCCCDDVDLMTLTRLMPEDNRAGSGVAQAAAAARDGELLGRIQAAVDAASPLGAAITQIRDRLQLSGLPGSKGSAGVGAK